MVLKSYYKYVNTLDIKIPKIQPSSLSSNQNIPSWPSHCMLLHLIGCQEFMLSFCLHHPFSHAKILPSAWVPIRFSLLQRRNSQSSAWLRALDLVAWPYIYHDFQQATFVWGFFGLMGVMRISAIEHTSWYPGWIFKNIH